MATRTFWLSFTDPDRPAGAQFLGVCIVDVSGAAAATMRARLAQTHPHAQDGAEWIAAALRHAHTAQCNPGGEVGCVEITGAPEAATAPRNQLLSRADLTALGLVESSSPE